MDLFDIAAKITLNTSDYEKGLAGADKQGSTFADKLKKGFGTAAKVGGTAVAAIGAAAVALGKEFISGVSDIAAYGDQIDKNSQKMGISAQAYQEWDFILQHSGSSIDAMSRGMMTLSKQAESNSDAFEKLGISQEDLAKMSKEDLFAKTIEGLQAMGEGMERDTIASELFGGSAKELGPLLNTSAEDVAAMRKQVNDLGGVMSDKAVKDAAKFQDSLQNLKTVVSGIKRSFLSDFLPSITKVSDGLTKIFSGDKLGGLDDIKQGITDFVNNLSDMLPDFIEVGWGLIEALLQAINDNLPTLIERGADILLNGIIPGIIENLPALVETALSIISQLVTSIGQALPELIPAAVSMIIQIVESLLDNIDLLIDAAIELIMGLADGILAAIPKLIEKAPEIVIKLVDAIIRNAPKLLKAAAELIGKLVQGIGDALGSLWNSAKDIVKKLGDGIKDGWEKVKEWGKNIVSKIGQGITDAWDKFKEWAGGIITKIKNGLLEGWQKIKDVGKNLVEGLWNGIKEKISWLWEKVKGWANGLVDGIKDILGIASPSKVFAEMGRYSVLGLGKGWDKEMPGLEKKINASMDGLIGDLDSTVHLGSDGIPAAKSSAWTDRPIYLVLDTGELVGRTVGKYDAALGSENAMQLRWEGAF